MKFELEFFRPIVKYRLISNRANFMHGLMEAMDEKDAIRTIKRILRERDEVGVRVDVFSVPDLNTKLLMSITSKEDVSPCESK